MIQVNQLSKTYNGITVLNIENLAIPKGQSFGLVGNNGAGKTTFFSLLLDLIPPSTGTIVSHSVQVNTSEDWKPFTAAFIDESFLIGYLTAEEYFYFIGDLRHQNKADVQALLAKYEEFFNGEILNKKKFNKSNLISQYSNIINKKCKTIVSVKSLIMYVDIKDEKKSINLETGSIVDDGDDVSKPIISAK